MAKLIRMVINKRWQHVTRARAAAIEARRERLREKLEKTDRLGSAPDEHRVVMPESFKHSKVYWAKPCVATWRNGIFVTHDPVVRFVRTEVSVAGDGCEPENSWLGRSWQGQQTRKHDRVYFDVKCWTIFKLVAGMQFAIFTERRHDPRYLFFQNVTGSFDANAHLHKQGMFNLHSNAVSGDRHHDHVCKPGTMTPRGFIANARNGKIPMSLLENNQQLIGKWGRLYQIKEAGRADLLMVDLRKLREIPEDMSQKTVLPDADLIETDLHPYVADKRCVRPMPRLVSA